MIGLTLKPNAFADTTPPGQPVHEAGHDKIVLSSAQHDTIDHSLASYGVEPAVREQLFKTLGAGGLWESERPNAVPVDSQVTSTATETKTVDRFADGSVAVETISS